MKRTFEFTPDANGENAVEVSAFYRKAGTNWYNGAQERGGFYVSFQKGTRTKGNGYYSFECMMFGGFKVMIVEASRDNKKKAEKILTQVTEQMARDAFEGNQKAVFDALKTITV